MRSSATQFRDSLPARLRQSEVDREICQVFVRSLMYSGGNVPATHASDRGNAPIQWSQEWLRTEIGERAQLTNDARWSFRKRPCGSSDRRRSTKSEKCGYTFASRSASMQCSFPQCARPLNSIKEESTSLRYRQ